ncbi:hypothetical protein CW368_01250 [Actinomycetales bacterium SN12]|nr:hypothetical protein CW368_01250 [Actinomycetales bacterium SN12]
MRRCDRGGVARTRRRCDAWPNCSPLRTASRSALRSTRTSSVPYDWIDGHRPEPALLSGDETAAAALGDFLSSLQRIQASDGPVSGPHSAWRDATTAPAHEAAVWLHGDVAIGNLLVDDRHSLSAVLDFGCSAVGDPACDTVIFWTQFRGTARQAFRTSLGLDDAAWARGAGWALWKGLIMLTNVTPGESDLARRVLHELLDPE